MNQTYVITVACCLSASNDYMSTVGLELAVDWATARALLPDMQALGKNIEAVMADAAPRQPITKEQWDEAWDPGITPIEEYMFVAQFGWQSVSGSLDADVLLAISESPAPPVFVWDKLTPGQAEWLGRLVREQLAICLTALALDVYEARPYDN